MRVCHDVGGDRICRGTDLLMASSSSPECHSLQPISARSDSMSLHGKVAIVTGGNSGIGKAVVLALAERGASIAIDYVMDPESTEDLEKQVTALGDKAIGIKADVSKVEDLQMLVDETVKAFG